jgi:hypothetical protein
VVADRVGDVDGPLMIHGVGIIATSAENNAQVVAEAARGLPRLVCVKRAAPLRKMREAAVAAQPPLTYLQVQRLLVQISAIYKRLLAKPAVRKIALHLHPAFGKRHIDVVGQGQLYLGQRQGVAANAERAARQSGVDFARYLAVAAGAQL